MSEKARPLTPLEQAVLTEMKDPARRQEEEKELGLLERERRRNYVFFAREVKPDPDYRDMLVVIVQQQVIGVIDPLQTEGFETAMRQIMQKISDGETTGQFTSLETAAWGRYIYP